MVESLQPENNETVHSMIMNEVYVKLPLVEQQSNPWAIQQYIINLLLHINGQSEMVNSTSENDDEEKIERKEMRREILSVMNRSIPLTSMHDVQQMTFALHLMTVRFSLCIHHDRIYHFLLN